MDVAAWLRGLGLGQYEQAFRANDIDAAILPELTSDDLVGLGVGSIGHRRRLLAAMATLAASPAPSPPTAVVRREAERRQLTVMFVDLVGSTALSARLDPEAMSEVLRGYQNAVAGEVARFEGLVAKLMGDGVLAYFGWPKAHEDEAERSVRAGLAIVSAVAQLTGDGEALACRVGIATGLVVVGDLVGEGAAQEHAVVGDTPNLASRLQGVAEPGQVVLAEATRQLLGDLFVLRALGPQSLKGIAKPAPAFAVLGERALESRFAARQAGGVAPLVGRDQELALLVERWRRARSGEGQLVLLTGEAGIGKSRLTEAVVETVAAEPHFLIRYQCSPYHADSALWPVIEYLRHAAGFSANDTKSDQLDKIEALVRQGSGAVRVVAPLLAELVGLQPEERYGRIELTPQARRARTLRALSDDLVALAARRPVLLVLEDAHWLDPSTLEVIDLYLDRSAALRVLTVVTSRPDRQPELAAHPRVTRLTVSRLGQSGVEAIVAGLSGDAGLPAAIVDAIVSRTDGVPLFVEEMTKAVLEAGAWDELQIPASLHDSLMARLDRLPEVREVAQVAACIGRAFDYRLLVAVAGWPEPEVVSALGNLAAAELVFCRGTPPEASYTFKHALVRDAAYESMLRSRRQRVHSAIAATIESDFPEIAATQPGLIARHSELAGQIERAVECWQRAGEFAIARSATAEAAAHFGQAVRCLASLPPTRERRHLELTLQANLGPALIHVRGYAARETGRAWARARELCRELDASDQIGPVLFGQYVFHYVRSEFEPARKAARELIKFGCKHDDPAARLVGMRNLGVICLSTGAFSEGRQHLEAALEGFLGLDERALTLAYGQDLRTTGLLWLAKILFLQGFPDRALAAGMEGLRRSEALGHSNTRAFTLCHAAKLIALTRDAHATVPLADATMEFATEQGYAQWLAEAWVFRGWARAELGELEAGLAELDRGARAYQASGAVHWRATHLGLRGRILTRQDRLDEALDVLGQALTQAKHTGEHWFEAELERLTGEVLVRRARVAEAEASFSRAIRIARSQCARMWELRAATSLASLQVERGEARAAHELLAPIHAWFTEGFATPDLIDAKACSTRSIDARVTNHPGAAELSDWAPSPISPDPARRQKKRPRAFQLGAAVGQADGPAVSGTAASTAGGPPNGARPGPGNRPAPGRGRRDRGRRADAARSGRADT